MKKLIFVNLLLVSVLLAVAFSPKFKEEKSFAKNVEQPLLLAKNDNPRSLKSNKTNYGMLYDDMMNLIKNAYVENVDDDKFFDSALSGMLSSLDPHSAYMSPEEYKDMMVQTKGSFSGIGIEITMDNSFIKIVSPIDDTPAYKAGIKAGDYISNINDQSTFGMTTSDAVKLMRGKDEKDRGIVNLTILRENEKEPLEFKIKRDVIKVNPVRARAEGEIIYIRIASFTDQTYSSMVKEFNKIENQVGRENVKGLILDLRNNPGGILDQSVFVSEAFLDKGKNIVRIKGKNNVVLKEYKSKSNENLIPGLPMVVLINEGSASASEIVAGALQDNKRAVVLGTKSFGKGSVQSVIELENGGAIKLTTARYYTPNDISIQAEGINPNIVVNTAKIEEIDLSKWIKKEESLDRHLSKENNSIVDNELKKQVKSQSESMYNKDYQLSRAIDLLQGISFYNHDIK